MTTLIKYLVSTVVLINLVACTSAPTYRAAAGAGFGFSEQKLAEGRYQIIFKMRGTRAAQAQDYALLRAAELTLLEGYDWYEVEQRDSRVREQTRNSVSASQRVTRVERNCGLLACSSRVTREPAVGYGAGVETSSRIEKATLTVQMGRGVRPTDGESYDAREQSDLLGEKLGPTNTN